MTDIYNPLNYQHLLYFVAVVQEEGLVPAAERLHVSHPTVSEQLKKLRNQLGVDLFERRGRKLQLTETGEMVYRYAREIFGVGAELLDAVEAIRSGKTILGRIGIDSVLAKLLVRHSLSPVIDTLGAALRLRCTEEDQSQLIAQLRARRLDAVLSDSPSSVVGDGVRAYLLSTSATAFFAAPGLAAKLEGDFPQMLHGAPLLLPLNTTRIRREIERWLDEAGIRPRIVAEIEDSGLLKALGQDGRGVFAMPAILKDEIELLYGVRSLGETADLEARVFALTTTTSESNPAVQALLASHHAARST